MVDFGVSMKPARLFSRQHPHHIGRAILRQPSVALLLLGAPLLAILAATTLVPWWSPVAVGAALVAHAAVRRPVQVALRSVFRANVALAQDAVGAFQPNVVVASSWGGAVAVQLIADGTWRGPTVLLAPAYGKLQGLMGTPLAQCLEPLRPSSLTPPPVGPPAPPRVVVVHSPRDRTIPYVHSEAMVAAANGGSGVSGGAFELVPVDDDHALNGVLRGSPSLLLRLCHRVVSSHCASASASAGAGSVADPSPTPRPAAVRVGTAAPLVSTK